MKHLLLAATALLLTAAAPATTAVAPRSRTFLLTCRFVVPAQPAGTQALDFWMPFPHSDKSQDVQVLEYATPTAVSIATDAYGNQILHLHSDVDAPVTKPLVVMLTARVTRREHLNLRATDDRAPVETEATDPNLSRWLAPDRLVPLDAKIKAQALEVVAKAGAKTDLQKARAIYEHVVSTVTYDKTGQGWGRGDIYYACDARRGNCTDFHAIVIGYCRALGIPARFSIGLPLPVGRGKGEIKGYHCWAEFFTKQTGWVPVDASEAAKNPDKRNYFFGAHDENRVEFTRGRDLVLTPRQAGPPLNYFVYPYAEADGKPVEVERTYLFADEGKTTGALSPAQGPAKKLLFVYNADGGPLNGFKDMLHKTLAPSSYECPLCAKTYAFSGMRPEWKRAVAALPLPTEFQHRDEFRAAYPALVSQSLPAAFSANAAGQLTPFISTQEMNTLDLPALITLTQRRAAALVVAQ